MPFRTSATLILTAVAIAPSFVVAFAAADRQSGVAHATEAGSWINAVHNMALAGGSSLGDFLVEWRNPAAAFALGGRDRRCLRPRWLAGVACSPGLIASETGAAAYSSAHGGHAAATRRSCPRDASNTSLPRRKAPAELTDRS